ncbi:MAG: hypothetical protein A2667_00745 [Candidatus Wildermuthbacteria bacterium RIFCSPHIGHO2_01_FULL_47_27]|uniref:Thioredoxin domain-containing protein n=1 Tax=Candidatus Wildermuthbacteria bacterium RIFCSPHIGHO2_02_FULL_47_17 TaxID=1802452 RepID=A0A1G2R3C1_9BACT|nr:MAG: hypothetical protein UY15_C0021G0028 [Parcubacteria group bacterium GW2011_GWA2_47_9]OHA64773.1 MAG: hypothetical protein A2667_00745 [Candidatus Wildermuthbacteria bacterium RIFCSPHIGHO2_01_FULL_47_27]OHA67384.1 MAG: hypothetical protein A3D59_01305 [Candidatus Wildermuthbacteria bacterium RIFCSPHIGHO2_02_FULL_47_17]OHA76135.1 MAG: hypothetical protein A3I38_02780 [Candidatus Wildermuthbacteria bacterium RIFCSPLOWO2_02_FULL_47_10]
MEKPKLILTLSILILLLIGAFLIGGFANSLKSNQFSENTSALDDFAKCLTDKGAVMYGAYWCPHCQNEKRAFGDSFKLVNYVECTEETQKCLDEKIEGYPTWTFPDGPPATTSSGDVGRGRRFVGEQGIEKLAEESGCEVPK